MPHSSQRPLLLGHRGVRPLPLLGVRWRKPHLPFENTLAAFDYALAHGCDGFEFDLRYTRDRRSICCHDAEFKGREVVTTDRATLERRSGGMLASLDDVLGRYQASAWLDIEVKAAGEEEALAFALRSCRPQQGFVVSSFLPAVLKRLHDIDPSLPLGYICDKAADTAIWSELPITVFIPHHSLVTEGLVDRVHLRGKQIFTWTVNRREDLLRFANLGVDGLISDDPKLLSQTFSTAPKAQAS